MNRKLQRSTLALSATSAVLAMLLLAGGPAPRPSMAAIAPLVVRIDPADNTADLDTDTAVDTAPTRVSQRRHARRSRAALALPYFSFAQGLRRVTGS